MAWHIFNAKPLSNRGLAQCWFQPQRMNFSEIQLSFRKRNLKVLSAKQKTSLLLWSTINMWELSYLSLTRSVSYICVGKLIIIGSDNGLSPDRRQTIIWTNAGLLSIEPLWTYFSGNLIKIQQFSLKKSHVKMSSAKWRLFPLGLNVLIQQWS